KRKAKVEEEIDMEALEAVDEGSSAVDLGGPSKQRKGQAEAEEAAELLDESTELDIEALDEAEDKDKKKKSKVVVEAEEDTHVEDEEGGVAVLTRKPVKPKYGRRWLGGIFLGILFAVGGAAAVWYFAPELLDEIPTSPNAKPKKKDDVVAKAEFDRVNADLDLT